MAEQELAGIRVIVAGAGLAGLVAARDLEAAGANGTIVEARGRGGGGCPTISAGVGGGARPRGTSRRPGRTSRSWRPGIASADVSTRFGPALRAAFTPRPAPT